MNKNLLAVLCIAAAVITTGCTQHIITSTPASMTYDGSGVDYSKIESMKHATVCKNARDKDGDTTIITAAKSAGIKHVKHVDTSHNYTTDLFGAMIDSKNCVTVYGD